MLTHDRIMGENHDYVIRYIKEWKPFSLLIIITDSTFDIVTLLFICTCLKISFFFTFQICHLRFSICHNFCDITLFYIWISVNMHFITFLYIIVFSIPLICRCNLYFFISLLSKLFHRLTGILYLFKC
jgi:hypothetical protein